MKIITSHDMPPIPVRDMDWSAHTDNYEASYEEGHWMSNEPIGHGPTEVAAVNNLLELLEDDGRFGELVESIRTDRIAKGLSPDTGLPESHG